ncbi:CRP-like cAMP-binding protein [Flavobacterium sp. W4I14]|nr:CRP-like cAMP-binding protein [Flavobacterium sp. W4I14]
MLSDFIFEALLERISSFKQITSIFTKRLRPLLTVREVVRGEILLRAGSRPDRLWFLHKGYAREVGHDEDDERTSWFYFENDFMLAYPSFFSQLPAFRDIELLSEGTVVEISYSSLILLRQDFQELNIIIDLARDHCESDRAKFASQMHTLTARERYEKFYQEHKALFNVARHKDIANFLRIKSDGFRRYNH